MELKINLQKMKKMELPTEAFIIYSLILELERVNIIPYRVVLHRITGYSLRSITRYFSILKDKGLIKQTQDFKPISSCKDKSLDTLFNEVYNKIVKR